jgi:hypothetical protein
VLGFVGAVLAGCFEPVYKRNATLAAENVPIRLGRGPGETATQDAVAGRPPPPPPTPR